jgi:cystathionine beta-lyase
LRTLAVRLQRHTENALKIARWLRTRPEVEEVIFPALEGARDHELWKRDFTGACGLFGVILKPAAKARVDAMLEGMRLFRMGWSWGGFESLIIRANVKRAKRTIPWQANGPYLRLHVGLEHVDDLIADLADGLDRLDG